jgi:aminoglycoside phosphotransferase (APT) family kinase protein
VWDLGREGYLDAGLVSRLVADQFPELAGEVVRPLGAGWDNDVYSVGRHWAFRFPKRSERVPWLEREIQVVAVVGESLGSMVPRFHWFGQPSDAFPFPFVGYRQLPGVGADETDVAEPGLARDLGRLLSRLHQVDTSRIPPLPARRDGGSRDGGSRDGGSWDRGSWGEIAASLTAQADVVRPLLPGDVLGRAEPYLAGQVAVPQPDGPARFIHNDICADHVLLNRDTGRLSGLIDFADSMVGDPVHDFVGLIQIADRHFAERVAAHYELPLGHDFAARFEWLTRTLTLTWLAEAATHDTEAVGKHLVSVARAFGD